MAFSEWMVVAQTIVNCKGRAAIRICQGIQNLRMTEDVCEGINTAILRLDGVVRSDLLCSTVYWIRSDVTPWSHHLKETGGLHGFSIPAKSDLFFERSLTPYMLLCVLTATPRANFWLEARSRTEVQCSALKLTLKQMPQSGGFRWILLNPPWTDCRHCYH
jgi:hypothetical protein